MSAAKQCFMLIMLVISIGVHCQETSPIPPAPQLRARSAEQKQDFSVILDAVVLDGKGRPVEGLQQADFSLLDDKKKASQATWQLLARGTPVSQSPQILFVLDAINSSLSDMARNEEALETYLKKGSGPLSQRTTILFVSDAPSPGQQAADKTTIMTLAEKKLFVHRTPTTTDRTALVHALQEYRGGMPRTSDAQGSVVNGDRVRLSLQALSYIASAYTPIKGPKLVLWLGPGWPFLAQSAAKSSEQLFDSIIYFTNSLQEAQITLYSITPEGVTAGDNSAEIESFELAERASSNRSIGSSPAPNVPTDLSNSYYGNFLKAVRNIGQSNPNDLDLQVLAFHTGGLVLTKNNDLVAQIERCVADAAAMYIFSYTPEKAAKPDTYHELSIRTARPSDSIRTITGFYTR